MNYLVIKEFGTYEEGMWLEPVYNEDTNEVEYYVTFSSEGPWTISEETAKTLFELGYLAQECDECPEDMEDDTCDSCDKLDELTELIGELTSKYENNMETITAAYDRGEIPACVKLESDTVHTNMLKLLKKFNQIING